MSVKYLIRLKQKIFQTNNQKNYGNTDYEHATKNCTVFMV